MANGTNRFQSDVERLTTKLRKSGDKRRLGIVEGEKTSGGLTGRVPDPNTRFGQDVQRLAGRIRSGEVDLNRANQRNQGGLGATRAAATGDPSGVGATTSQEEFVGPQPRPADFNRRSFDQSNLEAIQSPQTTVPLEQRLGEIESQRSALSSLRQAQIAAADGPRETRPGFENVTVVGRGGPTGILDEARARAEPRRLQEDLDDIDSAQRRGRITPSAAARQKQAVLGAISAADKQDTLTDIAAGRQATDLALGEAGAVSDLFSAQSRAATENAKLNQARQKNIIDERFKAGTLGLGAGKQATATKKLIGDLVTNEQFNFLNRDQKATIIGLFSGDPTLADELFPEEEE